MFFVVLKLYQIRRFYAIFLFTKPVKSRTHSTFLCGKFEIFYIKKLTTNPYGHAVSYSILFILNLLPSNNIYTMHTEHQLYFQYRVVLAKHRK